jgi:hypothetical protein
LRRDKEGSTNSVTVA